MTRTEWCVLKEGGLPVLVESLPRGAWVVDYCLTVDRERRGTW